MAMGMAAAAETPSSVSRALTSCDSSSTLMPLMYSTTCSCVSAAMSTSLLNGSWGPTPTTCTSRPSVARRSSRRRLRFALLLLRLRQHVHEVPRHGAEHAHELLHRRLQHEQQLGEQFRPPRQRCQLAHLARPDPSARAA